MMNLNFIAMGRLKKGWYSDACAEYIKRLGAFARVTVKEPEPFALPQDPSAAQIEQALEKEARVIRESVSGFSVAMCVEGKQLSSEQLAAKLESLANNGISCVSFIVGSSFGLSEGLKAECGLRLSMSAMTFPHELARVMLLEQVYRAFSIINNSKYHK